MVVGSFVVGACLMVLGWTKEIVAYYVEEGPFRKECTVMLAVLSIYAIDFAINAGMLNTSNCSRSTDSRVVQGCCRSLIVDTLPVSKQQVGSAWGKMFLLSLEGSC